VELGSGDRLGRAPAAGLEGDGGVGVAVDDQGGDLDLGQIVPEVGGGEGDDAAESALRGGPGGPL